MVVCDGAEQAAVRWVAATSNRPILTAATGWSPGTGSLDLAESEFTPIRTRLRRQTLSLLAPS